MRQSIVLCREIAQSLGFPGSNERMNNERSNGEFRRGKDSGANHVFVACARDCGNPGRSENFHSRIILGIDMTFEIVIFWGWGEIPKGGREHEQERLDDGSD